MSLDSIGKILTCARNLATGKLTGCMLRVTDFSQVEKVVFGPAKSTHGVKLTVSGNAKLRRQLTVAGNNPLRRPRRKFVFETCVTGWDSEKHRKWLEAKNSDNEDDRKLPAVSEKKSNNKVTLVVKNKSSCEEEEVTVLEVDRKLPAASKKKSKNKVTLVVEDNSSSEEEEVTVVEVDKDRHKETGLASRRQATVAVKKTNPAAAAVATKAASTNADQGEVAHLTEKLAAMTKQFNMTKKDNKHLNKQVAEAKSSTEQSNSNQATALAKKVVGAAASANKKVMSRPPYSSVASHLVNFFV